MANVVSREQIYDVTNYSLAGGAIRSSLGLSVTTEKVTAGTVADSWMIGGVVNPLMKETPADELAFIRHASLHSRRTAGLCTGTFVLGQAGLLGGRRVTTHWAFADALRSRCLDSMVEADRIFIVDGPIWTSAGLTAAMDLALAMVEKDLGVDVAVSVARVMVMHQRRTGDQSQHSEMLKMSPKSDRIQAALDFAQKNLGKSLSVQDLANAAHLSPRQFSRVFQSETGRSPAKAIEHLRLETARNLIERGRHSLATIARETGFGDRNRLRDAFIRGFGVSPQSLRRESRASHASVETG
jgi:transcriptional regulator GlxA family with amidase domain